jgi:predicted anti-sigma-YlaC factor YlaD
MKSDRGLRISCKKATELIDKASFVDLTKTEKAKLIIHLSLCSTCKNYKDESGKLDYLLKHIHQEEKKLSPDDRRELLKKLFNE